MFVIRKGFDGLDIAYPLTISEELAEKLRECRQKAQEASHPDASIVMQFSGLMFTVAPTGARGGFAFRCDTGFGGPFGEIWFFKEINATKDPWGVRVSVRALQLALDGLTKTRANIEATLAGLGLAYEPGSESIGRVDVACDVFAPDLAPDRAHFVSHARSTIKEISENLTQVVGRSGRVESVTIGKNPNRQVILYDKRAEVLATNKGWWWPIWEEALPADHPVQMALSRCEAPIWRVEVRAFKRHLKEKWEVSTWGHLREKLPAILTEALDDVRYTVPTADSNRARWPLHPLWHLVRAALAEDLHDLASMADRGEIETLIRQERDDMLRKQIAGCLLTRAALNGVPQHRLATYAAGCADQIARDWERQADKTREKLEQASVRYARAREG